MKYFAYMIFVGSDAYLGVDTDAAGLWARFTEDLQIAAEYDGLQKLEIGTVEADSVQDALNKVRGNKWEPTIVQGHNLKNLGAGQQMGTGVRFNHRSGGTMHDLKNLGKKFPVKRGDKIICKYADAPLEEFKLYTVEAVHEEIMKGEDVTTVKLVGLPDHYFIERFIPTPIGQNGYPTPTPIREKTVEALALLYDIAEMRKQDCLGRGTLGRIMIDESYGEYDFHIVITPK